MYSGAVSILRYLEHEDTEENAAGRQGAHGEERAEAIAEAEDEEAVAEEEADSELEFAEEGAEEGAEPVMDEAELADEAADFELAEAAIETELEAATAETVETEPAAEDGGTSTTQEAVAQAAENALIAGASEEQVALAEAAAEAALADAEAGGEDPASAAMQAFGMVLSGEATVDEYVTTAAGETGDDSDFGPITPVTISGTVSGPQVAESGLSSLEVPTESASGAQASTFTTLPVSIVGTADAPVLSTEPASGVEDTAIPVAIKAALVDVDTSETLSLVVNGVPAGATLSAGTDNGDGSWILMPEELAGLELIPPANASGTYTLTVSATATETDTGDTATTIATIPVSILAVADAPVLSAAPAAGIEDTAIPLTIEAGLADTDASEVLSITITGLPTGATLSAGTDNADGSWTLMPGELAGLALIPAANASGTFTLTVSATASEIATGDTATAVATVPINITGVADAPVLSAEPAAGLEDTAIALIVDAGLTDTDASEVLSVTVRGVPAGALLTAGTDNGDGSWTLTPDQLAGLQLIPPTNVSGSFSLIVSATATETATGDTATSVATLPVSIAGVADAPILSAEPAAGLKDTTIPLTIESGLSDIDASEVLSLTISGMPAGFTLSAGTDNGDGSWTLTPDEIVALELIPAANASGTYTLTVSATATETGTGDTATSIASIPLSLVGVADAPRLDLNAQAPGDQHTGVARGTAGTPVPVEISASLVDTDASESLSVIVSGVPSGAVLSAGTDNGDGSWTLLSGDLEGLSIILPRDLSGRFRLTITATSLESGSGDTASTLGKINLISVPAPPVPTEGDDVLYGTPGADIIDGRGGDDRIYGFEGDDTLTGGTGSDLLSGGEGDDTLVYGADATWTGHFVAKDVGSPGAPGSGATVKPAGRSRSFDVFDGGEGFDVLKLTAGDDAIFLDDRYSVFPVDEGPRIVDVEHIDAGGGDDIVDLTSKIYSYDSVTVTGGSGNDIIWSSAGDDTLHGGTGDDWLSGGAGDDVLIGGTGDDQLYGGEGDDVLAGGAGENVLHGGAGTDTADYSGMEGAVRVRLDRGEAEMRFGDGFEETLEDMENVVGSAFDDDIRGDRSANALWGGAGDDMLRGGGGDDALYGEAGGDILKGEGGRDELYGLTGEDILFGGGGSDVLHGADRVKTRAVAGMEVWVTMICGDPT